MKINNYWSREGRMSPPVLITFRESPAISIYSIYKVTCLENKKCYIGFTKNLHMRKLNHLSVAYNKNNRDYNNILYRAIRKYEWNNFTWETIYQSKDEDYTLNYMEPFFIKLYNTYSKIPNSNGYNMTPGGDKPPNCKGKVISLETRRKISDTLMGRNKGELNPFYNKNHSPETILKLSKKYMIIFPNGQKEEILNLNRFCKENNLAHCHMSSVATGKRKHHKGFKCLKIN